MAGRHIPNSLTIHMADSNWVLTKVLRSHGQKPTQGCRKNAEAAANETERCACPVC
jgi:hypothetical protein